MITTRQINVNLAKEKLKQRHATTKDIDAGVRVEPPKEPIKPRGISTTTLPDVADIAEKKRRDDIMAERKLAVKDEKKIVMAGKDREIEIITAPASIEDFPYFAKLDKRPEEKKPWKEMTDEEKKIAMKERTAKMMTTKARKKKEKNEKVATG